MARKQKDFSPQLAGTNKPLRSGNEPSLPLSEFDIFDLIDMLNPREQRLFTWDCAELVLLPLYEAIRPNDSIPRSAVEQFRKFILSIPSLRKLHVAFRENSVTQAIWNYDYLDDWPPIVSEWLSTLGVDWEIDHRQTWDVLEAGWTKGLDPDNDANLLAWTMFLMIRDQFTTSSSSLAYLGVARTIFATNGSDEWHRKRIVDYSTH
jgi:hypothetical protein